MEYSETNTDLNANETFHNSSYRKKEGQKIWMTVREMGDLLGLKKTDRYWLVHKKYFQTEYLYGQMRVNIQSFETWYANQIKYKKISGEEPGKKLKELSYSPKEISEMLEITESVVYDLIKQNGLETVLVNHWKRVPKEAFWNWYDNQTRYRTKEARSRDAEIEDASVSMPEMAQLLGIPRSEVYALLRSKKYRSIFKIIIVAERKRITKTSFKTFLSQQSKYALVEQHQHIDEKNKDAKNLIGNRNEKLIKDKKNNVGNSRYITVQEAALLAGVTRSHITRCISNQLLPAVKTGAQFRILRADFEKWLQQR